MKYLSIAFLAFMFIACGGGGNAVKECPFGKPKPLFSKEMPGVSQYSFTLNGDNSAVEKLSLPQYAYELEILESGCEQKTQEIRLTVLPYEGQMDDINSPSDCAQAFGQYMTDIATIAPEKLLSLQNWGIAIAKMHSKIQYNSPTPIDNEPFTVQIDMLRQPQSTLITVVIKNT